MDDSKVCFDVYSQSKAIIYSSLEGQYQGHLKAVSSNTWLLFTPFDFHFLCGEIPKTKEPLTALMRSYVQTYQKKMFVLLSPTH